MNKILTLLFIVTLISVTLISSADLNPFSDTKTFSSVVTADMSDYIKEDFNSKYGVITLNSKFMYVDTGKVAEYSLTKNTEYCIINCEAEGKVKLYSDGVIFDDVKFKTLTGQDTSIVSSEYYVFNGYKDNYVDVPDTYKKVCIELKLNDTNKNETQSCSEVVDTYKSVNQPIEIWDNYTGGLLRAGEYRWKIKGQKKAEESVDFIPMVNSKEFSEWAVWNSSFNVNLTNYWTYNTGLNDSLGILNMTGVYTPVTGILSQSQNYTGSYWNYVNGTIPSFGNNAFSISFWIKTSTACGTSSDGTCCPIIWACGNNLCDANAWVIYLSKTANSGKVAWGWGSDVESPSSVADGNWKMITYVRENNQANGMKLYINGINVVNGTENQDLITTPVNFSIGGGSIVIGSHIRYMKGLLDEIGIWKRALTPSEVTDLYNGGSGMTYTNVFNGLTITNTYPLNNANITTKTITFNCSAVGTGDTNLTSITLNVTGTATWNQTITGLNTPSYNATFTNNTILNGTYTWNCIGTGTTANSSSAFWTFNQQAYTTPTISLPLQSPSDLNLTNFIGVGGVNITYNISSIVGIPINLTTIQLFYKANSTIDNVMFYQNGTSFTGYFPKSYTDNSTNITFRWNLLDNEILLGTYNYGEVTMENTPHILKTLTNTNNYLSVEILNVSNITRYSFYEIMANSTNTIPVYYCNSSYAFGNSPTGNNNCVLIYTIPANQQYNHRHTQYSAHQVIPFAINVTSGSVGTVKVTSTSNFIIRGAGTTNYYVINNGTRANAFRESANSGNTWTANNTISVDAHLHQFPTNPNGNASLYYYSCANDTNNNSACSPVSSDIYVVGGLPPNSPQVYSPTNQTYAGLININYTASFSPNGYDISNYNITLWNNNTNTFNQTIRLVNGLDLSYAWNSTSLKSGSFYIEVRANDSLNQQSFGQSEVFSLDNQFPLIEFGTGTAVNNTNTSNNFIYINTTWIESNFANISFCRSGTPCILSLIPIYEYNFTGLTGGTYYYNVTICDLYNNCNSTETRVINIDLVNPSIILVTPTNNSYVNNATQNFTINITDDVGIKNATFYLYNQTDLVNKTEISFATGVLNYIWGIPKTLIDNTYNWFADVFDFSGRNTISSNSSVTIDTISPVANYTSPTTPDLSKLTTRNIIINVSASDVNLMNVTTKVYNSAFAEVGSSTWTNVASNNFYYNFTASTDGTFYFNSSIIDRAGNINVGVFEVYDDFSSANIDNSKWINTSSAPSLGGTSNTYQSSNSIYATTTCGSDTGCNQGAEIKSLLFKDSYTSMKLRITLAYNENDCDDDYSSYNSANFYVFGTLVDTLKSPCFLSTYSASSKTINWTIIKFNSTTWKAYNETNYVIDIVPTNYNVSINANSRAVSRGTATASISLIEFNKTSSVTSTRTVYIDTAYPVITITYPTGSISGSSIGSNLTLTYSIVEANPDTCWLDYQGINTTIACGGTSYNFTLNSSQTLKVWANDTFGQLSSATTSWLYPLFENSQTYNLTTYETANEGFVLNITYDNLTYTFVTANLVYDGTSYAGTKVGTTSTILFTRQISIPSVAGIETKSFYWDITLTNSTTSNVNSTTKTQTVSPIIFTLCNSTYNVTYINYTFIDESTGLNMNASIDLLTQNYGIVGSLKQYLFSNTSLNNPNYQFCFSPPDKTILAETKYMQYSFPLFPQRHFYSNGTLSNATTNTVLYLLGTSSGIYTTLQVVNQGASQIAGVEVSVQRKINGVFVVVEQGTTDTAGLVTFWLNPNYDHLFTLNKVGYLTTTVTLRPTQSIYTVVMTSIAGNITYVNAVEGVSYTRTPLSGILKPGLNTFTYNISSSRSNMVNCRFELVHYNGSMIDSATTPCTSNGYLSIDYTIANGESIFVRYYVDMGNGSILLESDGNYRALESKSSAGMVTSFLELLNDRNAWGINDSVKECHRKVYSGDLNCRSYLTSFDCALDINNYGTDNTESECVWEQTADNMKFEFTMIVMVFLLVAILGAGTNLGFNYDLYNPGSFLYIIPIIFAGISMAGAFGQPLSAPHGLLYIDGLTSFTWINNYIVAIYSGLIAITLILRNARVGA